LNSSTSSALTLESKIKIVKSLIVSLKERIADFEEMDKVTLDAV
jgi:hypothetical protein